MEVDFIEYYHIFDYRALSLERVVMLFFNLSDDSRSMMQLKGLKVPMSIRLQAMALDALNILVWQNSVDGQKGKNPPQSITEILLGKGYNEKKKDNNILSFPTSEEWEKERERRLKQWQQS